MTGFSLDNAMFLDGVYIPGAGKSRGIAAGDDGGGPTVPISKHGTTLQWSDTSTDTIDSGASHLTTTLANSLILVAVCLERGSSATSTVASIASTSGLTFAQVPGAGVTGSVSAGSKHIDVEVWQAFAPGALAAEAIVVTLTGSCTNNICMAIAMQGLVGTSGIYTLDGAAQTDLAATGTPSVTMDTTHGNDLLLFVGGGTNINANVNAPTGFTSDGQRNSSSGLFTGSMGLSHKIVGVVQSGLVLAPSSGLGVGACLALAFQGM